MDKTSRTRNPKSLDEGLFVNEKYSIYRAWMDMESSIRHHCRPADAGNEEDHSTTTQPEKRGHQLGNDGNQKPHFLAMQFVGSSRRDEMSVWDIVDKLRQMLQKEFKDDGFDGLPLEAEILSFRFGQKPFEKLNIQGVLCKNISNDPYEPTTGSRCHDLREEDMTIITSRTTIFETRKRLIENGMIHYNVEVDKAARFLERIKNKYKETCINLYNTAIEFLDRFEGDLNSIEPRFSAFDQAFGKANLRNSSHEERLKGHADSRVSVPKSSRSATCSFLAERSLSYSAHALLTTAKQLHQVLQSHITERYKIHQWLLVATAKLMTIIVRNHRLFTTYCSDVETEFLGLLSSTNRYDVISNVTLDAIERPAFERTVPHMQLVLRAEDIQTELDRVEKDCPVIANLEDLTNVPIPPISLCVGSVMGLNSHVTVLKDHNGQVIPDKTPIIIQLTWDRQLHVFRSFDDTIPLRSVDCLHIRPELHDDGTMVIHDERSIGVFGALVPPTISFSFIDRSDLQTWKTLLRYACTEVDSIFVAFARSEFRPSNENEADAEHKKRNAHVTNLKHKKVVRSQNTASSTEKTVVTPAIIDHHDETVIAEHTFYRLNDEDQDEGSDDETAVALSRVDTPCEAPSLNQQTSGLDPTPIVHNVPGLSEQSNESVDASQLVNQMKKRRQPKAKNKVGHSKRRGRAGVLWRAR